MKQLSPRQTLVIIAALFVGPLALAWLMYAGVLDFHPSATRNRGTLIEPAQAVSWNGNASLERQLGQHWVLLHPVPDPCQDSCLERVTGLRQIHRAAGRHQDRLRIGLVTRTSQDIDEMLLRAYGGFTLIRDAQGSIAAAMSTAKARAVGAASSPEGIYLVDPLGNIMMFYSADVDPGDIQADLKRLLKYSKLDERS